MFYSPLRYPGGKGKLSKLVEKIIIKNKLSEGIYIEPFAGGAAIALYLLINKIVSKIIINDADPTIYAFWWNVINNTEWFINKIKTCVVNLDTWYQQREIYNNHKQYDISDVGFAAFFLNRTNVSGIIKGGCIGGKDQTGKYKIDSRFNKKNLIDRIELIAKHRNKIDLYCKDTAQLIDEFFYSLPPKSLIFFDPPYYLKGSSLYKNFYQDSDHKILAQKIKEIETPWIVTYDDVETIKQYFYPFKPLNLNISYSLNLKRKAKEIMFLNKVFI